MLPGSGAGAGPVGSFGPFCLYTKLTDALAAIGFSVMRVMYPIWAIGKMSVSINAVRYCVELLRQLAPSRDAAEARSSENLVVVGWSMGGAVAIEAAARLLSSANQQSGVNIKGVVTLAAQAAGLLHVGNRSGCMNSLKSALAVLGEAEVPLVAIHGACDMWCACFSGVV